MWSFNDSLTSIPLSAAASDGQKSEQMDTMDSGTKSMLSDQGIEVEDLTGLGPKLRTRSSCLDTVGSQESLDQVLVEFEVKLLETSLYFN